MERELPGHQLHHCTRLHDRRRITYRQDLEVAAVAAVPFARDDSAVAHSRLQYLYREVTVALRRHL